MGMNRRGVIEAIGVGGLTVLAGCSSNSSNEQSEQGQSSAPVDFEIVAYNTPKTLEIGERGEIEITVHNAGERKADFRAPLYVRTPGREWEELGYWTASGVLSGFNETLQSPSGGITKPIQFDHIQRVQYRLGELSKSPVIQITPANLSWGEQYTTPEGYIIGINQPRLQDTYEHKKFGYTVSAEPDDGNQWVFVNAYVKNETGQTALSPFGSDFVLIYDNSQVRQNYDDSPFYDPINQGDEFEGGELQPGIERSGWIAYQIPSNISANEITIAWSKTTFDGDIIINWGSGESE
jgi:hypothetical protein